MEESKQPLHMQIDSINKAMEEMKIKQGLLLNQAISSNDPNAILKAQSVIKELDARRESERKSIVVDPNAFIGNLGYKDKPVAMSYSMLYRMAKTPIINAIIRTRINQVAAFAEPQRDRYSTGYVIRKRKVVGVDDNEALTPEEEKEIFEIQEFIENCGKGYNYDGDRNFDTFVRKVLRDSLTYDQLTFEVEFDRKGRPFAFYSTDAATIRIADSIDDAQYDNNSNLRKQMVHNLTTGGMEYEMRESEKGYYPSYVQIYNNHPIADFYPWQMCFGVRNPVTSIYQHGYGLSELEEMVLTITSMLWGEEYNRKFFKQGSMPKGMLRVKGNIPDGKLNEFKQMWNATMRGVWNSWKTPIMEADQVEWVDLQKSNRDMEFNSWIEYLIKIGCAIYNIDPAEVNFPLQGGSQGGALFEGSNEQRLKHSKDKGLYPLLKFLQAKINRYIVRPLNPKYEFAFVGLDVMSPEQEQKMDIEAVQYFKTVNEVRESRGMQPIDGGDIILNPTYMQQIQMEQQAKMMEDSMGGGYGFGFNEQEFVDEGGSDTAVEESEVGGENQGNANETTEENVENEITKAFENYLTQLN